MQETATECFHDTFVNIKIPVSVACDYESKASTQTIVRTDHRHDLVQKILCFSCSISPTHHDVTIVFLRIIES